LTRNEHQHEQEQTKPNELSQSTIGVDERV